MLYNNFTHCWYVDTGEREAEARGFQHASQQRRVPPLIARLLSGDRPHDL